MAKRFRRCYIFEVAIFFFFFKITLILICGPDDMMSQPETRLQGREENKNHSLNSINCLAYLTFIQSQTRELSA